MSGKVVKVHWHKKWENPKKACADGMLQAPSTAKKEPAAVFQRVYQLSVVWSYSPYPKVINNNMKKPHVLTKT